MPRRDAGLRIVKAQTELSRHPRSVRSSNPTSSALR